MGHQKPKRPPTDTPEYQSGHPMDNKPMTANATEARMLPSIRPQNPMNVRHQHRNVYVAGVPTTTPGASAIPKTNANAATTTSTQAFIENVGAPHPTHLRKPHTHDNEYSPIRGRWCTVVFAELGGLAPGRPPGGDTKFQLKRIGVARVIAK